MNNQQTEQIALAIHQLNVAARILHMIAGQDNPDGAVVRHAAEIVDTVSNDLDLLNDSE